jgi:fumarate reductase subunit D
VVQAVASAQAGGISYDALWHANERLKAENDALWQAWVAAEELSEAKQRAFAGSGGAMGLSLSQIVTLFAIALPLGIVPSRAMVGRWVQAAAAQAGRLLMVLDLACQARRRGRCLDEIFLHREPVLMAIAPHSMAWMAGQRGPDRRGERWREVMTHWPCLEPVIADGGQGLARGVKLAHAARGMQGAAAETIARQAMTMGLDVLHTQRELERVLQRQGKHAERQLDTARQAAAKVERYRRQGREPRGVSGGAGRAWRKAERLLDQAGNAQEAVQQIAAALSWFDATGRLSCRQTAQAQRDEASQRLQGDCWSKVKRLLRAERTLRHVDRLREPLTTAVSEPVLRDA